MENYIKVDSIFGEEADRFLFLMQTRGKLGFCKRSVEGRTVVDIMIAHPIRGEKGVMVDLDAVNMPEGWEDVL